MASRPTVDSVDLSEVRMCQRQRQRRPLPRTRSSDVAGNGTQVRFWFTTIGAPPDARPPLRIGHGKLWL